MKKNLFGVLGVLALSVALVGCESENKNNGGDGGDGSNITGLTVTPNELTFADGDAAQRLAVTFTPSGASATVTWTSTDTTVATVNDKGVVTPVYSGETKIVATAGNYSDTCYVKVKPYLETLVFNNAVIWSYDTLAIDGGQVHEITASDGTTYKAYLAKGLIRVFAEGLYLNNSGYVDGSQKGAILEFYAPFYLVTNYLNNGKGGIQFSLGAWAVSDQYEANTAHVGLPTVLDSVAFISNMESVVSKINTGDDTYGPDIQAAGASFSNAKLGIWEYTTDESGEGGYSYSYVPDAVVLDGIFSSSGSSKQYRYMLALDYSQFIYKPLSGGWFGCNIVHDENTNTYMWVDKYIHLDDAITSTYGTLPTNEAPEHQNSRQGGQKYKGTLPTTGLVPMPAHSIQEDFPEAFNAQNRFVEKQQVQKK